MKTRTWGPGWGLVAFWLVTASTVMLLQSWLFEVSFLMALASLPLLLMLAIGLLIVLLALRAWDAALVFVAATVVIPFLPFNYLGHQAWTRISFMQHRAAYEKIVARAPDLPDRGTVEGEPIARTAVVSPSRARKACRTVGAPSSTTPRTPCR